LEEGKIYKMITKRLKHILGMLNIGFAGFIPNKKLPDFFNSFDVFAPPSILDSETFGVVVVEASACGVPEVCIGGKTGILVEPKNPDALAKAIIKLAKDPDLLKNMGKAGNLLLKVINGIKPLGTCSKYCKNL
jgi:glycosyltransferase involved in cell wall biosynthesis